MDCGCCKVKGYLDMDRILETGKKILPTPAVLFFAHVIFATVCALVFVLNIIFFDDGYKYYCHGEYWTIYVAWILGIVLGLLISYAKYRENNDVICAIISFFAFWGTLFALQTLPFYCYGGSKAGSIVRTILRAIIDVMLTIIYGLWSREEIAKLIPK